jgi:CHAT domain-containing protein/tetratricopeptide (TPR) repeat protein
MISGRGRAAEERLEWPPVPSVPRRYRRRLDKAGEALAAYVLDDDERARARLAHALDAIVDDPRFSDAPAAFRVALLNRCGVAHNWLGVLERDERELEVALERLSAGLAIAVPGSPERARLAYNRGNTLLNRYERGGDRAELEQALQDARQSVIEGGDDRALRALCLSGYAWILRVRFRLSGDRRDLDEAIDCAEKAHSLTGSAKLRSRYLFVLADLLHVRYEVAGAIDDLNQAIDLLNEARTVPGMSRSAEGPGFEGTLGMLLRNRYLRFHRPEDIDEAVRLMSTGVRNDDYHDPARLTNLGNALLTRYMDRGDHGDLVRAVNVQIRAVERTPPGDWQLASRHNNAGNALARAWEDAGDERLAELAADHYRASLRLTAESAPERASREFNLATLLERRGAEQQTEAVAMYSDAVRHGLNGSLEWALAAARRWGGWAAAREDWDEACQAYGHAMDVLQRLFRIQLLREEKEVWLAEWQGLPAEAAYAMVRASRFEDAAIALEVGRGLLLSEALDRDRADLDRLRVTGRADLADAYRAAAGALDAAIRGTADVTEVRARRDDLDGVIGQIRQVEGYQRFMLAPTVAELAQSVRAGTALAYLAAATPGGLALVVDGDGIRHIDLPRASAAALRRRVEALFEARAGSVTNPARWAGTLDAIARWSWEALIGPLLAATNVEQDVVLLPSGLLTLLPLHAAWTPSEGEVTGRRYALDQLQLTYAPNARALRAAGRTAAEAPAQRMVVIADPRPTALPPVGYASAEAAWATGWFPGSTVIAGERATRAEVVAALPGANVYHFICHGAAQPDAPLDSSLRLAGGDRLTLRDILQLRLRQPGGPPGARLAVLSACDTDRPGVQLPDEVVSLPTGLLQAGVAGVVATQWAVRSEAVSLVMARFYQAWRGQGLEPAAALRAAQRWLRDTTNAEKAADLAATEPGIDQGERRILRRTLLLRDPAQRSYTDVASWAALSYHGW